MSTAIKTLTLPFLSLHHAKAEEFARLQTLNTATANAILAMPQGARRQLTSKALAHVEMGSAWINQTMRHAQARTKVPQCRCLPLETKNQNWALYKVGTTDSVSFGLRRGLKKRGPLAVHPACHQPWLDAVLEGRAQPGSLQRWGSRKGCWDACLSVSMAVPDAEPTGCWMGLDRGQNVTLAAATPDGPVIFWPEGRIRPMRRVYAGRRATRQAAGTQRAVQKLECREHRRITHLNHSLSTEVMALAQRQQAGIRLEDLSGIRQRSRQRKSTKTDAGQNRDAWPFFQLEHYITYKAQLAGIAVEKVPAASTSQSCHRCGALGTRNRHRFVCRRCAYHAHADANAAQNTALGMACAVRWFLRLQRTGHMACPCTRYGKRLARKGWSWTKNVNLSPEVPGIPGLQAGEDVNKHRTFPTATSGQAFR